MQYGSLGSDTFIVTPQSVDPVISRNLRGHRGIIEHEIVSATDGEYDGLKVRGVAADVLDNDGNFGYVSVVDQTRYHIIDEDGVGEFTFWIFPTSPPADDVVVNIVSPAARDKKGYVLVNDNDAAEILTFPAGTTAPQAVEVKYNPGVLPLNITEINLLLKILVDVDAGNTKDPRFVATEQSLLPIDIKLIPGLDNVDGAIALTVDEGPDGTLVLEGGFSSS